MSYICDLILVRLFFFHLCCGVLSYPPMSYICDPASVSISQISPKPHFVACLNIEIITITKLTLKFKFKNFTYILQ